MANGIFKKWKEQLLQFTPNNSLGGVVKVALIDVAQYSVNVDADQFLSSVGSAIIGTPQTLTSKTFTLGTFDAADSTFPLVSGPSVEAIIIYIDTGVAATSPLVAYIDSSIGLPVTPNGGDIVIEWDPTGIFTL